MPDTAILWRFMIDRAHQAAGYGRDALALAFAEMRASGFAAVETSVVLGLAGPLFFYLSQGFAEAGRKTPSGEWVLNRPLS